MLGARAPPSLPLHATDSDGFIARPALTAKGAVKIGRGPRPAAIRTYKAAFY